jgi:hypothetical protein
MAEIKAFAERVIQERFARFSLGVQFELIRFSSGRQ